MFVVTNENKYEYTVRCDTTAYFFIYFFFCKRKTSFGELIIKNDYVGGLYDVHDACITSRQFYTLRVRIAFQIRREANTR